MPRPPIQLSDFLRHTVEDATRFLEYFPEHLPGYGKYTNFDELPEIFGDCDDQMMSFAHALIRVPPDGDDADVQVIIDMTLTLELRMAIAQAADVHRVLYPIRDISFKIAEQVRKEVETHDASDEEWEIFGSKIGEARCEILKFLSFALYLNQ